ncbi:YbhB/YbcL family Raf kinase inhibitor-like protein [Erythrobacter litoralis]|uniref:YbhB/YbcL family Raf kinase inhibitor-like protein n=1 Tax=Erythrobacter litoralis TaxID=39960 RepID=UPI002434FD2E|nr:YbhB/YbcL family Raf kinase inhibitor-like protein [Erythrobacter litoralis]MDG6078914.1 YbhB/YbcL family Raf kinase inhibitor-like protein [Erythrobacter litoralis]
MAGSDTDWIGRAIGGETISAELTAGKISNEKQLGKAGFALSSPAFQAGRELDPSFTAIEEDAVAPPLEWTAPPPGTQELVLVVEDAASGEIHWLVWGLAGQRGQLLEGEAPPRVGKNAKGNSEWLLPNPPVGVQHLYVFQLFALDLPLTLMPGATYDDLLAMMKDHVTAVALLSAKFEGHVVEDLDMADLDDNE